jgi:hypothetical protein
MVRLILGKFLVFMVKLKSGRGVLIKIPDKISHGKYLKNYYKKMDQGLKNGSDV